MAESFNARAPLRRWGRQECASRGRSCCADRPLAIVFIEIRVTYTDEEPLKVRGHVEVVDGGLVYEIRLSSGLAV